MGYGYRNPSMFLLAGLAALSLLTLTICGLIALVEGNGQLAVNSLSRADPATAHQLDAARRVSKDDVERTQGLASANQTNAQADKFRDQGKAEVLVAQGQNAKDLAVATKTIVESKVLDDDRQAKKFGYGGLAAADLVSGLGGAGGVMFGALSCIGVWLLLGFLGGVKFAISRKG